MGAGELSSESVEYSRSKATESLLSYILSHFWLQGRGNYRDWNIASWKLAIGVRVAQELSMVNGWLNRLL
jgi:hypothetical protein